MTTARRPEPATLAAFAASILIGGANAIAVRVTLRELTPFWGAAFRFGLFRVYASDFALIARQMGASHLAERAS